MKIFMSLILISLVLFLPVSSHSGEESAYSALLRVPEEVWNIDPIMGGALWIGKESADGPFEIFGYPDILADEKHIYITIYASLRTMTIIEEYKCYLPRGHFILLQRIYYEKDDTPEPLDVLARLFVEDGRGSVLNFPSPFFDGVWATDAEKKIIRDHVDLIKEVVDWILGKGI